MFNSQLSEGGGGESQFAASAECHGVDALIVADSQLTLNMDRVRNAHCSLSDSGNIKNLRAERIVKIQ